MIYQGDVNPGHPLLLHLWFSAFSVCSYASSINVHVIRTSQTGWMEKSMAYLVSSDLLAHRQPGSSPSFAFFSESLRGVFVSLAFKILKKGARDQAPETSFEIAKHFVSEFNLHNTNFIPNPEFFEPFFVFPTVFVAWKSGYQLTTLPKNSHFRRWWNLSTFNLDPRFMACCSTFTLEKTSSIWVPFLPFFLGLGGPLGLVFLPGFGLQESFPKNHHLVGLKGTPMKKLIFRDSFQGRWAGSKWGVRKVGSPGEPVTSLTFSSWLLWGWEAIVILN